MVDSSLQFFFGLCYVAESHFFMPVFLVSIRMERLRKAFRKMNMKMLNPIYSDNGAEFRSYLLKQGKQAFNGLMDR